MSRVSYAQNFEDVMLLRALGGIERGCYIDVGAQDPTTDSVTRLFYDRGWRGINIEPSERWYQRLLAERPEDVNLHVAISDREGAITFYEVVDTGLSTTSRDIAERHRRDGRSVVESTVAVTTLDSVIRSHALTELHFLKIDVEGAESAVLRGLSLDRVRPWILVIEATEPNTQFATYQSWESLLTSQAYEFAYDDGLNRFYVAQERRDLRAAFRTPPNCFDDFISYREWKGRQYAEALRIKLDSEHERALAAESRADDVQRALDDVVRIRDEVIASLEVVRATAENGQIRIEELESRLIALDGECHQLRREMLAREAAIHSILSSRSWRITAPLRWIGHVARKFVRVLRQERALLVGYLRGFCLRLAQVPWARALAKRLLARHPAIRMRLRGFVVAAMSGNLPVVSGVAHVRGPDECELSAREQRVLAVLKAADGRHQHGEGTL